MPHLHEKIDFTTEIYVVYDSKVLLRMHDKYDIWLGVGGHVEPYEDPNQAAVRESREEIGLDIKLIPAPGQILINTPTYIELIPPRFLNRHRINESHEHISMIYFATVDSINIVPGATEKDVECRWFTEAELDSVKNEMGEAVMLYAKAALKELSE